MEAKAVALGSAGRYLEARRAHALPDEFERLFLAEYPRVVAIAYRLLRDQAAAEDVAQEVFLDFHRRHSPVADYAPAWLHKAASHAALNQLRSARRRKKREEDHRPVNAGPLSVEEEVERREDQRAVRAALARMPKRSAALLALRSSGLTYAETAAALGVSVSQVGTMLRRAEARLLKEVQE